MDPRLFIAIEMPESWIDALTVVQDRLRGQGLERLRWVRPEGIHLTLAFLGNVPEARVPDLTHAMTGAAAACRPFTLALARPGMFGSRARPRVLWVGLGGDLPSLERLHHAVDTAVRAAGFTRPAERFAPHLTLARVPDRYPPDAAVRIAGLVDATHVPPVPPFSVERIALMRSELLPGGARYHRVADASLKGNPPPNVGETPDARAGEW